MDNTSRLLDLAKQKFGSLTAAEETLFRAVANGEVADYSAEADEDNDPAKAANWGPERVLNADRIAWLCTDKCPSELVTYRGIWIKGGRVDGNLDLAFAKMSFPLRSVTCALTGDINLEQATLYALDLSSTRVGSISADGARVGRDVVLASGFRACGEVHLIGARIGGDFNCENAKLMNRAGDALGADGIKVEGDVILNSGFTADGEVRLLGAVIGGNLDCSGGQFMNEGADALSADGAQVQGNVFLSDGFKAEGRVRLISATIGGMFHCVAVLSPKEVELDLRSASVGTLRDEKESWPGKDKLFLHGLVYNEIHNTAPRDPTSRIEWLRRQNGFWPQPYEHLAAVLRKGGDDAAAKKILIVKNKDKARLTKLTWSEWLWYRVFGAIIGYGYRPWRALWIGVLLVLLGWLFFWAGYRAQVMTPAKDNAQTCAKFCAFVYSLDVFVPLVDLHQASYWLPNANRAGELDLSGSFSLPISGKVLRYYLWFEITAGWVLTTLLVVGVTGLVRT